MVGNLFTTAGQKRVLIFVVGCTHNSSKVLILWYSSISFFSLWGATTCRLPTPGLLFLSNVWFLSNFKLYNILYFLNCKRSKDVPFQLPGSWPGILVAPCLLPPSSLLYFKSIEVHSQDQPTCILIMDQILSISSKEF